MLQSLVVWYHVVWQVDTDFVRNEQGFSNYQIMWHCDPDDQNMKLFHHNNHIFNTRDLKLQVHFSDKIQLKDTQSVKRLTTVWRVWFLTGQTSSSVVNIQIHTDKLIHFYNGPEDDSESKHIPLLSHYTLYIFSIYYCCVWLTFTPLYCTNTSGWNTSRLYIFIHNVKTMPLTQLFNYLLY